MAIARAVATHSCQCVQYFCVSSQCLGFLIYTDVDACDCGQGLYKHCRRICTEGWLWEDNSSQHWGIKPTSVLPLAFQSNHTTNWAILPLEGHVLLETSQKVVDMSDWKTSSPLFFRVGRGSVAVYDEVDQSGGAFGGNCKLLPRSYFNWYLLTAGATHQQELLPAQECAGSVQRVCESLCQPQREAVVWCGEAGPQGSGQVLRFLCATLCRPQYPFLASGCHCNVYFCDRLWGFVNR